MLRVKFFGKLSGYGCMANSSTSPYGNLLRASSPQPKNNFDSASFPPRKKFQGVAGGEFRAWACGKDCKISQVPVNLTSITGSRILGRHIVTYLLGVELG